MTINHFRYLFNREFDVFYLTEHIMLFKKPYSLWNEETGEEKTFKDVDEMLRYNINGETVEDIIKKLDKPFTPALDEKE